MRKNRASRCQHLCRSWRGIPCCSDPGLFTGWGGGGMVVGANGHEEQVIGRQTVEAKEMLRCQGMVTPSCRPWLGVMQKPFCNLALSRTTVCSCMTWGSKGTRCLISWSCCPCRGQGLQGTTSGCTDVIVADKTRFFKWLWKETRMPYGALLNPKQFCRNVCIVLRFWCMKFMFYRACLQLISTPEILVLCSGAAGNEMLESYLGSNLAFAAAWIALNMLRLCNFICCEGSSIFYFYANFPKQNCLHVPFMEGRRGFFHM